MVVLTYLTAIILANLAAATFGPGITPFTAFLFIGLDLLLRDVLHERWRGEGLLWKMGVLIAVGGFLSWVVQADAGRIALASSIAFALAATFDAVVYQWLIEKEWLKRANVSNVAGAAVDSVAFPTIAFGALLPWIVLGQFAAKVLGGFLWSIFPPIRNRQRD